MRLVIRTLNTEIKSELTMQAIYFTKEENSPTDKKKNTDNVR